MVPETASTKPQNYWHSQPTVLDAEGPFLLSALDSTSSKQRHLGSRQQPGTNQHTDETARSPFSEIEEDWKDGRVLVIDYNQDGTTFTEHSRKEDLEGFFDADKKDKGPPLRLIHVQNATWAKRILLQRFNIPSNKEIDGTLSGNAERYQTRNHDARDIPLRARATSVWHNKQRKINRASFECDFLKGYDQSKHKHNRRQKPWLEFHDHDKRDLHVPQYHIHVDEISVYLQSICNQIRTPVEAEAASNVDDDFENGNTIIIFSDSVRGLLTDLLIGARRGKEIQWTRFATQLKHESAPIDNIFISNCMEYVLNDILKSIMTNWSLLTSICESQVSILEHEIYRDPEDDSKATQLSKISGDWITVGRLMYSHRDLAQRLRFIPREMTSCHRKDDQMRRDIEFDKLQNRSETTIEKWNRNIVKRTEGMLDLMYKAVSLRDTQASLRLSQSMAGLSWITFIFLPLTFSVGVFGMNVSTFESNPSIKWWFATSALIFVFVILLFYFMFKLAQRSSRRTKTLSREGYESLYKQFTEQRNDLWTEKGPMLIEPSTRWEGYKWFLITSWFDSDKVKPVKQFNPIEEHIGLWNLAKRELARHWLKNLEIKPNEGEKVA